LMRSEYTQQQSSRLVDLTDELFLETCTNAVKTTTVPLIFLNILIIVWAVAFG